MKNWSEYDQALQTCGNLTLWVTPEAIATRHRVESAVEQAVVEMAIEQPAWGQLRLVNELAKRSLFVSSTGVRIIWLHHTGGLTAGRRSLVA